MRPLPLKIVSMGSFAPPRILTAEEAHRRACEATGKQINRSHFSVAERRLDETGSISEQGAKALNQALEKAGLKAKDLDLILFGSSMPEQPIPATSVLIHQKLNLEGHDVNCFDLNSSCTSFLTGLEVAAGFLETDRYKKIAVVSSEIGAKGINWKELESANLFGDGAAAAIVEKDSTGSSQILSFCSKVFSSAHDLCEIKAGGSRFNIVTPPPHPEDYLFTMDGRGIYRTASRTIGSFVADLLKDANLSLDDMDWIIPHQASPLALQHMTQKLGWREDRLINVIQKYGNQVAASIPTALHECLTNRKAKRGDKILLIGTGAGLILSGAVVVY